MDSNLTKANQVEDEEEYILLDLDDVCVDADIPANTPFVLSGLDTMNPVLAIGDHLKLECPDPPISLVMQNILHDSMCLLYILENTKRRWEHVISSLKVFSHIEADVQPSLLEAHSLKLTALSFTSYKTLTQINFSFFLDEAPTTTCPDTTTSETNSSKDKQIIDAKQALAHQVKPIASLQKILKFKLVTEDPNGMVEGMITSMA
ncbi:hypothetical protein ZIOFF_058324 [Zingiber officinale]|uniref:Transcription factor TFIIIC triple barrel domain-containing protein n=1 Tax=Zingiber officinale TaxID=94328 RepID=A0A8J5F7A8_ZINOF|nr:hypothetical protein ZIOFF_058324 [Zingiber officinale]